MTWIELARVHHENEAVLASYHQLPNLERAERARRLGLGQFALVLIERRLERIGALV